MRPERSAIYLAIGMLAGSALLSLGVGSLLHTVLHLSVRDIRTTVRSLGPFGAPAVTVMIAAIIVFIPIPTIPIELVAGAVYGIALGTVLVLAGHVLGAVCCFVIARQLGRPVLRRFLSEKVVRRVDEMSGQSSFWIVFFMRLLPLFDFKLVSYAGGLTAMRFRAFVLATTTGIFLPIVIMDAIGATAAARPREAALIGAAYSLAVAGTIAYFTIPRRKRVVHIHHTDAGVVVETEIQEPAIFHHPDEPPEVAFEGRASLRGVAELPPCPAEDTA